MITGGSSGIGKHLAVEAVRRGASVSLLARDPIKLEEARVEILQHVCSPAEQKVACLSVDVGGPHQLVQKNIEQAEEELGPVYLLANCAGYAQAASFEDMSCEEIQRLMNVNYMGAAQVTRAIIGAMKGRRDGGKIIFVSSQAGLSGIYGLAAYSASKFALRGLAEALAMELRPYKVSVTVSFPPDTDTPGYVEENRDKPQETKLISEAAGLFSPQQVASTIMKDALDGKFMSTVGFEGFVQATLCAGMSPFTSVIDLLTQMMTMGIFRLVSIFYLFKFNKIVERCMKQRNERKRSE